VFTGRYPHSNGLIGLAQHGIEYHERVRTLPQIDLYLTSREALANIFGVLDGLILPVLPVVSKSALPGLFEAGLSCFANGFSVSGGEERATDPRVEHLARYLVVCPANNQQ